MTVALTSLSGRPGSASSDNSTVQLTVAATLAGVTVTGDRTATSTTVTVTGHSVRLVPFMDVTVSQSATLPVERYTR